MENETLDFSKITGNFNFQYHENVINEFWGNADYVLKFLEKNPISKNYEKISFSLWENNDFISDLLCQSPHNISYIPNSVFFSTDWLQYLADWIFFNQKNLQHPNNKAFMTSILKGVIQKTKSLHNDRAKDDIVVIYQQNIESLIFHHPDFVTNMTPFIDNWEFGESLLPFIDKKIESIHFIKEYVMHRDIVKLPGFFFKEPLMIKELAYLETRTSKKEEYFSSIVENTHIYSDWYDKKDNALAFLSFVIEEKTAISALPLLYRLLTQELQEDKDIIFLLAPHEKMISTILEHQNISSILQKHPDILDYFLTFNCLSLSYHLLKNDTLFPQFKDKKHIYQLKNVYYQMYFLEENWDLIFDEECPLSWKNNYELYEKTLYQTYNNLYDIYQKCPSFIQEKIKKDQKLFNHLIARDSQFYKYLSLEEQLSHVNIFFNTNAHISNCISLIPPILKNDISFCAKVFCYYSKDTWSKLFDEKMFNNRQFIVHVFSFISNSKSLDNNKLSYFMPVMQLLEAYQIKKEDYGHFLYDYFSREILQENLENELIIQQTNETKKI